MEIHFNGNQITLFASSSSNKTHSKAAAMFSYKLLMMIYANSIVSSSRLWLHALVTTFQVHNIDEFMLSCAVKKFVYARRSLSCHIIADDITCLFDIESQNFDVAKNFHT